MHSLAAAGFWLDLGLDLLEYVILPVLVLVGLYVFLQRSASTHFGVAGEFEREGNLAEAARHYDLAARYAKVPAQKKAARAKEAEVRGRAG